MPRTIARILTLVGLVALLLAGPAAGPSAAAGDAGNVYTLTNTAAGNAVIAYARSASGDLTWSGTFATQGGGGSLGSQGSVVVSDDGRWLYAVNAGTNNITVFGVSGNGLTFTDLVASNGTQPISVTTSRDLVYVVNATSRTIAGFRSSPAGTLTPIAGSVRSLIGSGPAEIAFSPSGGVLVVTEKATSTLETFVVGPDGAASAATSYPSSGATPFGFAFGHRDQLFVSEAAGAPAGLSAASSYQLTESGTLTPISASVPTTQAAACWLVVTGNGRYAFTANAASDSISTFAIDQDGSLTLVIAQAAHSAAAHTTDLALTRNSRFLYANDGGTHMISAFRVGSDGSLERLAGVTVPAGSSGLASR